MKDPIERQAAIDAMCSVCGHDCDKSKFVYNAPQWDQVILCPEHYALTIIPSAKPKPPQNIQDILDYLDTVLHPVVSPENWNVYCDLYDMVSSLSTRQTGGWIYGKDSVALDVDGYFCSECNFFIPWDYQHKFPDFIKDYHYCPNCGADMGD